MSKHTPGPWRAVENGVWTPWPDAIAIEAHGHTIAWLTSNASKRDQDRADARTLAAAAEMLECLVYLRDLFRDSMGDASAKIDAVIAKATGEA